LHTFSQEHRLQTLYHRKFLVIGKFVKWKQIFISNSPQTIFTAIGIKCVGEYGGAWEKPEAMLQEHKRGRRYISTQNLKALGKWVTSFINQIFFPYIINVRLNHSHLKLSGTYMR
jgi:hypothetical protein